MCPVLAYVRERGDGSGRRAGLLVGRDADRASTSTRRSVTYIPQYRVRNDFRLVVRGGARRASETATATSTTWRRSRSRSRASARASTGRRSSLRRRSRGSRRRSLVLPFDAALIALDASCCWRPLGWTWYLLAPGARPGAGCSPGAAGSALFPVAFGADGRTAGRAGGGRGRDLLVADRAATIRSWPGVALSLIVLKPQLALLVPLCLLVSGHAAYVRRVAGRLAS